VWNRLKFMKNSETGRRQSRLNPRQAWIIKDVPELRIVPQELWDAVKARQGQMARDTPPIAGKRNSGSTSARAICYPA
jgi:site-specific DNA recombinase